MKTQHFLLLLSLFAVSCTKDADVPDQQNDPTPLYPISILAGQDTGVGISHVDFSPDLLFNVGPYHLADSIYLDVDSDQVNDFKLNYAMSDPFMLGSGFSTITITPLGNNRICVSPSDNTLADSLSFNDPIDSTRTWSSATARLYYSSWSQSGSSYLNGYFYNNTQYYVGLRLTKDQQVYYGWIFQHGSAIDQYGITRAYVEE